MKKLIKIFDTTLRDGAQSEGISFTVEDKIKIVHLLDDLGIHYIEGGWPGSNPKDAEFFKKISQKPPRQAKMVAFGSTRRPHQKASQDQNLKELIKAETPVVIIFGKSWDFHVTKALKITLDENLKMISDSLKFLKKQGGEVFYDAEHFFDGFKNNPDYAMKTLEAAEAVGARVIVLCDTNGGSLPTEVKAIIQKVQQKIKTPLGIHAHNDSDLAVANSIAAVEAGCVQVQGTINGYGERAGNANLCSLMPILKLKMGFDCISNKNLAKLSEISHHIAEIANLAPNDHSPFVGRSAFSHKGGIHVSAVLKFPETYEHINPETVGNERRIVVSELSGVSNLIYKAREFGIDLTKDSPEVRQLLVKIKELEHFGYQFEEGEASFELLLKKALGQYQPFFKLEGFKVDNDKLGEDQELFSEATIKVKVKDKIIHSAASGNGPVSALDAALRAALEPVYPAIKKIKLVDYKVRVLDSKDGTAAKVRVIIESSDDTHSWGTVGVSTNIIEASYLALVDSLEYKLLKGTK